MKVNNIRCMSLPKGVPVQEFDTLAEALSHVKGDETKLVGVLNKYGRQKDSLVDAREYLSEQVEALGFKIPTHQEKQGDKTVAVPDWTDKEHLNNFVSAAADGKVKVAGLTVNGGDLKAKKESVWTFLQSIIDKHGKWTFDLNETVRVSKAKKIPQFLLDAATTIINNGAKSIAKWQKNLTEGYNSEGYGDIEPVAFAPFNQTAPAGASTTDAEAVRKSNIENLARALVQVEDQKRALRKDLKKEYA